VRKNADVPFFVAKKSGTRVGWNAIPDEKKKREKYI
jgi:hypothetical protein